MTWVRTAIGAFLVLIGLVWIGQGVNLIPGSMMTGQPIYAVLGAGVAVLGIWLLRKARRRPGSPPSDG